MQEFTVDHGPIVDQHCIQAEEKGLAVVIARETQHAGDVGHGESGTVTRGEEEGGS